MVVFSKRTMPTHRRRSEAQSSPSYHGLLAEGCASVKFISLLISLVEWFYLIGQEAGSCIRTVSFTGRDAANYTTILMGLWSDSHRRLRGYETRPVAAEAQRRQKRKQRFGVAESKTAEILGAIRNPQYPQSPIRNSNGGLCR